MELKSVHQIIELCKSESFKQRLSVKSKSDFRGFPESSGIYSYTNKESGELVGINICSTPNKGNNFGERYSSSVSVFHMFGDKELPFGVSYEASVPYLSNDENEYELIGRFKTVYDAMLAAVIVHEKGPSEIYDIDEMLLDRKREMRKAKKNDHDRSMTC
ncbi:hypothetical protein RYA05_03305 [Pseudomonas syringae pv. actinidiae]|nr:hypothetical protein [Pseudomonas syringae pv. actinidiae]